VTSPAVRRVERPSAERPRVRRAEPGDIAACAELWRTSIADYLVRLNQPDLVTDLAPVRRLLAHFLETDPGSFLVATRQDGVGADGPQGARGERVVAFASANVRGHAWFLGMLFVLPAEQRHGLGSRLLEATLPNGVRPTIGTAAAAPADGSWTFGTATDSVQPISNALYARLGLVPRVPVLHLAGTVRRTSAFPALPGALEPHSFDDAGMEATERDVADLDRDVLGYERPQDHAYLRREGRAGWLYRTRGGDVLGYGYTSRAGRVGPIAVRRSELLPAVLGHLLAAIPPAGAHSVWVPGAAGAGVSALLEAGLWLEPFPALHCWDRPSVDDSRYVPISLALL
jgi:GNAT superfamily N-acetyltransferase